MVKVDPRDYRVILDEWTYLQIASNLGMEVSDVKRIYNIKLEDIPMGSSREERNIYQEIQTKGIFYPAFDKIKENNIGRLRTIIADLDGLLDYDICKVA